MVRVRRDLNYNEDLIDLPHSLHLSRDMTNPPILAEETISDLGKHRYCSRRDPWLVDHVIRRTRLAEKTMQFQTIDSIRWEKEAKRLYADGNAKIAAAKAINEDLRRDLTYWRDKATEYHELLEYHMKEWRVFVEKKEKEAAKDKKTILYWKRKAEECEEESKKHRKLGCMKKSLD